MPILISKRPLRKFFSKGIEMEKFWSKGVGGRIQSYREISWTIVVSGGNCRIDIQTASPGESLERDVVVQLNRKLCSRYKANRNFPPVYSAF